jgi:hypothetical protein
VACGWLCVSPHRAIVATIGDHDDRMAGRTPNLDRLASFNLEAVKEQIVQAIQSHHGH